MIHSHHPHKQTVVFLHIPKTAGTTVSNIILRNQYQRDTLFFVDLKKPDAFLNLSEHERARLRVIHGHFLYGIHNLLPNPAVYFTLLRDPVDRIISYYYFVMRDHQLPHPYNVIRERNMSLEDFARNDLIFDMQNGQTRMLAGHQDTYVVHAHTQLPPCTRADLEQARHNLQHHFAEVGIQEYFDEMLILLGRTLGWRDVYYRPQLVSRNRKKKEEIAPETRRVIEQHNDLDMELYTTVREQFEQSIKEQGLALQLHKWLLRHARLMGTIQHNKYSPLRRVTLPSHSIKQHMLERTNRPHAHQPQQGTTP